MSNTRTYYAYNSVHTIHISICTTLYTSIIIRSAFLGLLVAQIQESRAEWVCIQVTKFSEKLNVLIIYEVTRGDESISGVTYVRQVIFLINYSLFSYVGNYSA